MSNAHSKLLSRQKYRKALACVELTELMESERMRIRITRYNTIDTPYHAANALVASYRVNSPDYHYPSPNPKQNPSEHIEFKEEPLQTHISTAKPGRS